jgi:hypothetical protein
VGAGTKGKRWWGCIGGRSWGYRRQTGRCDGRRFFEGLVAKWVRGLLEVRDETVTRSGTKGGKQECGPDPGSLFSVQWDDGLEVVHSGEAFY